MTSPAASAAAAARGARPTLAVSSSPVGVGVRKALVGVALAAAAFLVVGIARPGSSRPTPSLAPPLRVVSTLPAWLAPGAKLSVRGWADRSERVELLLDARVIGRSAAGRLGGFRVVGAVSGPGRYRVGVRTARERQELGTLVVRPLVIAAAGDVTFGDGVAEAISAYGPRHPWLAVAPILRAADIATVNLEGVASTRGTPVPDKAFTFRGPPAALEAAVRFAGIDVFSVANNHSLDYGVDGFLDTLRRARALGAATAGGGASLAAARARAVIRAGGLRVAFLGYSDVNPPGFVAGARTAGTAPAEPALIAADVRAARRRADLVVVWFHWGIELMREPDGRQQELAAAALNAGAGVVLGAHPHVLQPIARPGRRVVAWSLGNFVFQPHSPGTDETGILRVLVDARGARGYSFLRAEIVGVQPRLRTG